MNLTRREMLVTLAGGAAAGACAPIPRTRPQRHELFLCGWDEVFLLSLRSGENPEPRRDWSWRAADCPNLPDRVRGQFRTTDECKPIDGGLRILISSSSHGCAVVERETKRALFWASVTNAHSIERLPNGRLVVAASVSGDGRGNRIVVFSMDAPEKELLSDTLPSAHGLVWGEERDILWALGYVELRAYRLRAWESPSPRLEREATYPVPDESGHDLSPIAGTSQLFVSTNRGCWLFDRDRRAFARHDSLGNVEGIKSYSIHPATGQIAYVQAEGENWWAERVHLLNPKATLHLPGEHLYKARWNANT